MNITAYKTHKITKKDTDIFAILDKYLPTVEEKSIIVITSKIIAICEGSLIPLDQADKDELVKER